MKRTFYYCKSSIKHVYALMFDSNYDPALRGWLGLGSVDKKNWARLSAFWPPAKGGGGVSDSPVTTGPKFQLGAQPYLLRAQAQNSINLENEENTNGLK